MVTMVPLIYDASGETKKATKSPISRGCNMRPNGKRNFFKKFGH